MIKKRYPCMGVLSFLLLFVISGCNRGSGVGEQVTSEAYISKSAVSAKEDAVQKTMEAEKSGDSCHFDEKTGTLTFDGVGECGQGGSNSGEEGFDLDVYHIEWRRQVKADRVKEVVVGDGITQIGYAAFADMENLESVTIGNGVTKIQKFAFARCPKLRTVVIGDSVQKISNKMFWRDSALETVSIGKSVQKIVDYAFLDCSALREIWLDSENPYLKEEQKGIYSADGKQLYLYPVAGKGEPVIAAGTEKIFPEVFAHSKMKRIMIPASVKVLGGGVFHGCKQLEAVSFEKGSLCTKILPFSEDTCEFYLGETDKNFYGCFQDCISLKEVSFPEYFQRMDCEAFVGCKSLESIYFGREFQGTYTNYLSNGRICDSWYVNDVEPISSSLQSIRVSSQNKKFMSKDGVLFSRNGRKLLYYPITRKETEYTVPADVQIIGEYAFLHNKTLQRIDTGNVQVIEQHAFEKCKRLSKVILEDGVVLRFRAFADCHKLFSVRKLCRAKKVAGTALIDTRVSLVDKRKNVYNPFVIEGRTMRLEVPKTGKSVSWEVLSGRKWVTIVKKYHNQGVAVKFLKVGNYKMKVTIGTEIVKFKILVRKKYSSPW